MRFEILIDTNNAGCATRDDILSLVRDAVKRAELAGTYTHHDIRDVNGNKVGFYAISADDTDEDSEESTDDEDTCDECGATYPSDAHSLIGTFHSAACSLHSKNTV
jgi:hypothetical protein